MSIGRSEGALVDASMLPDGGEALQMSVIVHVLADVTVAPKALDLPDLDPSIGGFHSRPLPAHLL